MTDLTLTLYNTLSRKKEVFKPADPSRVTVYNCGPTVYSYAHIGNARAAVAADVLFRVLRHIYGAEAVVYARNLTDIDDKIIKASMQAGVDMSEITEKFARIYNEDLAALNCLMPTFQPKATDNIDGMADIIVRLLDKDIAYVSEGHVLFDVTKMAEYGKLSGRKLDDNLAGARVEVASYKKNAGDFVLWKPSKEGEPSWNPSKRFPSGRPGWHIECSAMIKRVLCADIEGETIDIHCGGIDLKFPHHENEIAQSECAHGQPLARYWMHNEFLNLKDEKMSKSKGNVVLVHDLLMDWDGEVIRLALLKAHYRSELIWSEDLLAESKAQLDGWYRALLEGEVLQEGAIDRQFMDALLSDMNSAQAVSVLGQMEVPSRASANLLGLLTHDPDEWFRGDTSDDEALEIDALIAERDAAKIDAMAAKAAGDKAAMGKAFGRSDEIRDMLKAKGIVLEDGAEGTTWRRE